MSWIHRFFERFKKEEEAEQHEIHTNKRFLAEKKQPLFKELEARITYQYPKGQFRFPIIPDEKKAINHNETHVHRKKQPIDRIHSNRVHEVKNQKEKERPKKEPLTKIYSSGPFRPTEIPSPIFGFNRPKETVVEYELSHVTNHPTKGAVIKNETSNDIGKMISIEPAETVEIIQEQATLLGDTENILVQEHEIPINNEAIQTTMENETALTHLKADDESKESGLLEPAIHLENNDVEATGPGQAEAEKAIEETAAAIAVNEPTNEQTAAAIAVNEPTNEQTDSAVDNSNDHTGTDQLENTEEESAATSNETSFVNTEPEKAKRTHLPFNVMMLKQDRQKWVERKKPEPEEKSKTDQPDQLESEGKATAGSETSCTEIHTDSGPGDYEFPTFQLLNPPIVVEMDTEWLKEQENLLNQTLENFNVGAKVVNITQGPAVTRFEVHPEPGVKVNKVTNLSDDIKLSLAARDIRIEAPIPGKHTIGIEVPNPKSRPVQISEIIQSNVFLESASPLTAVLGLDISGKPIVTDLKKMPHGLIAGATGSGKSVCINSILVSLLYKASPEDLKLLLIDPKMVELAPYNRIPHLVSPVITDVKAATAALKWAVDEMERRYELFAHTGVRDINKFNELAMHHKRYSDKLPFIVIIIDELADLMMMSPADVEEAICRIAQKARACGIHLIIATQRPSVDVITGLIKANIPTRIAFSVSSQVDSRTIIDIGGAEKLLGRGDMLFLENGSSKPVRLQGTFVSDDEIDLVVAHVREQREPDYLFEQEELLKKAQTSEEDELFYEACEFVVDQASASTSSLQRHFKIGYNRAARLMEMMEEQGYISGAKGSKPRDVFLTAADLESIQETGLSDPSGSF